ncbi:MAG: HEAT repeat domain-containing protein [Sandaracinaceae bacterium]|nr:HEAT repeat domain-containing protein [Sandaracinaceae bacterium]
MRVELPFSLVFAVSLLLAPLGAAHAQRGVTPAQIRTLLTSSDVGEIRNGIEAVGVVGTGPAVEPLVARIRAGLSPELLDLALDTLLVASRPEAGPVLIELTSHRRAAVRLKAVQALVASHARGAEGCLTTALNDGDPGVRSAAALGLGQLNARGAVETLFLALERGVLEASTAIGQLAAPADIPRLRSYVGRLPFDAMTPAFSEILARRDVPERAKLDLIAQLAEVATAEVKTYLQEFVASLPATDHSAVRRAAEDATLRIVN